MSELELMERVYRAMEEAAEALEEACDCGCCRDAIDGLHIAMRDLDAVFGPQLD